MKGRSKKKNRQHLNRPHVRTRRADLLQCGPSQLAPRSMHILYLMQRNNQKMGGGGKKNKLPPTTTTGNPLATAESQSLHHNVQPASKKRITCFYLQPPPLHPLPPSILSACAHNRGSVQRKYWWASEILSNPNHLAAGVSHAAQDADSSKESVNTRRSTRYQSKI